MSERKESPQKKKEPGTSKREFLIGAGAVAAPLVLGAGIIAHQQLTRPTPDKYEEYLHARKRRMHLDKVSRQSPEKREAVIDAEVARVSDFIRSSEGKRILESGTDDEIWALITMLPPILRDDIRGTKYDISAKEWPSVTISGARGALPTTHGIEASKQLREYANGFFLSPSNLVTNWHVLATHVKEMPRQDTERIDDSYIINAIDVVHVDIPEGRIAETAKAKPLQISASNDSIHGSMTVVAGIRPDETADPNGTKLYPSAAIRMTPRLAQFFNPRRTYRGAFERAKLEKSFLVLLPPGETESSRDGRKPLPAHGMSGSPVLASGSCAGIIHTTINGRWVHKGISYNIGFFHGPDEIQKAREVGLVYKVPQ